jgi:hypothetical protein
MNRNRAFLRYLALPLLFLTVALLGGVRLRADDKSLVFIAPPLVTLVLAVLLLVSFVRGRLLAWQNWLNADAPLTVNAAHALTLIALFFASAQAFNAVLPERGLFFWLFSLFFLWALWQQQFALFDARRLLYSLAALFGTAFALKYFVFMELYKPDGGWAAKLTGLALDALNLGTQPFAPATGYLAFFTLALYVGALVLFAAVEPNEQPSRLEVFLDSYQALSPDEQETARAALRAGATALPPAETEQNQQ